MILGPILLVLFLIAFGITLAVTRDVWKSLGIGGAVAAVPIGAYFGGFWGGLLAAALGAAYGIGLPFIAIAAAVSALVCLGMYGLLWGVEGAGSLFGLSFGETMSGLGIAFWAWWFLAMLLGSPLSRSNPETLWDKLRKGRLDARRRQRAESAQANEPDSAPKHKLDLRVLALVCVAGGMVVSKFIASSSVDQTPKSEAPGVSASDAPAEIPEPSNAEALPHFSSLLGRQVGAVESWCAAKAGTWTNEWDDVAKNRCEFEGGFLVADRTRTTPVILTGVILFTYSVTERERRDLLSELGAKYGDYADYRENNSGFVKAVWRLADGRTVEYMEMGPVGVSVGYTVQP